jgi:hypothetical protein
MRPAVEVFLRLDDDSVCWRGGGASLERPLLGSSTLLVAIGAEFSEEDDVEMEAVRRMGGGGLPFRARRKDPVLRTPAQI